MTLDVEGQAEGLRQLTDGGGTGRQPLEDRAALRIRQGKERAIERRLPLVVDEQERRSTARGSGALRLNLAPRRTPVRLCRA